MAPSEFRADGPDPHQPLAAYRRGRDFTRTTEPRGTAEDDTTSRTAPAAAAADASKTARFVVQLHDASTRHFDFRLEVGGVLRSWAVPKGPSDDPHAKRLAVPTEDHPLEYRDFEGVIAPGEYGAGTVLVWDAGPYRNLSRHRGRPLPLDQALARGHASFLLAGRKLRGGFALTRFRGDDGAWLLVKRNDRYAAPRAHPPSNRARSVRSGRTLRQVAEGVATDG